MPQYGMQGASLGAKDEYDDDDDDDDRGSTQSAFSVSSRTSTRSRSFIGGRKTQAYVQRVQATPRRSARPKPAHTHTPPAATAPNPTGAAANSAGKGKRKNRKNKSKGKPQEFNIMVLDKTGWEPVPLKKDGAAAFKNKAIKNLTNKNGPIWQAVSKSSFLSKFPETSSAVSAIQEFASQGGFERYNTAITEIAKLQVKMKIALHSRGLYLDEAITMPYNTRMKKIASSTDYTDQVRKSGVSQEHYAVVQLSRLLQYFIKTLMSYTFDAHGKIPDEKIKEFKDKEKTIAMESIMREIDHDYNSLHNMLDAIGPWIQGFSKANELLNSKTKQAPGAKHLRVYQNEFAGIDD